MKKTFLLTVLLIVLPLALFAVDRVVVLEIATGTWCGHCPKVAQTAHELAYDYPGELLIVEYHHGTSDIFSNDDGESRISFYGITGYPTSHFDGVTKLVGDAGLTLAQYEPRFLDRKGVVPPLEINLTRYADAFASTTGSLEAVITNVSGETVSGYVHFTITESNIPYHWISEDSLYFVERDMLPDAAGEFISLSAGADTTIEREFTIDDSWPYFTMNSNIEFGCFVQGADKEIYQAAVLKSTAAIDEEPGSLPFSLKAPTIISEQDFIELSLDAPVDVDISLYNSVGRKLETLHTGVLDAGAHRIEIKAEALPAGTYFIKVTAGAYNRTGKLIILD